MKRIFFKVFLAGLLLYALGSCADGDDAADFFPQVPSITVDVSVNESGTSLIDSVSYADTLIFKVSIEAPAGFAKYTVDFKIGNGQYQNLQEITPSKLGIESGQVFVPDQSTFIVEEYMKGQLLHYRFEVLDLLEQSGSSELTIPVSN